jgi:hypothetical protein
MKDKIKSIEVAKAFFDAKEYSGSTDALFHSSLKYGKRISDRLKYLERRNKTLQGLYDEIYKEVKCIVEIVEK